MSPQISVLMPVYNAQQYLYDTITSILQQTCGDFELLIIDDASTDDSMKIIKDFEDKRIKYYKNEHNLGISATRNKLMDLAQGEYWAIIDNDDICLPERFAKQVKFLDENKDISVVGSWTELFCKDKPKGIWGSLKKIIRNLGWVWCQPSKPNIYNALHGCPVMHPSSMIRKADLLKHNLRYDGTLTPAEDFDLWAEAMMKGLKLANLQEVLFKYNLHGNNFSITSKKQQKKSDRLIKDKIKKHLGLTSKYYYPYWMMMVHKLRLKYFLSEKNDKNL